VATVASLRSHKVAKEVFLPDQVGKLFGVASDDWKGLILAGYYTGARLLDLSTLRWSQVDLAGKTITIRQSKTGSVVVLVMHPSLEEHLISLAAPDHRMPPSFPPWLH